LVSDEQEKFEDTNAVIRNRKSEDRQCNNQKKKNKHRCKTIHRKLKIEQDEPHKEPARYLTPPLQRLQCVYSFSKSTCYPQWTLVRLSVL